MSKGAIREVRITARECLYKQALHEHLQSTLGLPAHYGMNLSALADCLAECTSCVLITVDIEPSALPSGMQAYVLRLVQVIARESVANENVNLIIQHS